ncbi:putative zinc phosphodiesterase ELAC protein 2 [Apostichopus japonicus]|uniref:Zinc phosphodiesterase ELAC protein 2 n=1 Tax=Stichopus japonicus TaxID=307972 RepID=A0A2G8JRQ2_STIJA|nr:putative zinc phosphodiesterase ELAC protein 2 [Apostichopus japonicus]
MFVNISLNHLRRAYCPTSRVFVPKTIKQQSKYCLTTVQTMASQPPHLKKSNMVKAPSKLKHVRLRQKRGGQMFPSVNVSAQIIGSGTRDSPASVLVAADSTRYLFNCGEGTQRLMMECGTKNISKLEHIFFTRMTWDNLGGAIGMMITLKKVGLPKLTYYGPENLNDFVQALQIFAKQDMLKLEVKIPEEGPFLNETMVVQPVVIESSLVADEQRRDKLMLNSSSPIADDLSDNSDTEDTSLGIPINQNTKKRKADPLATISGMTVKPQAGKQESKRRKLSAPGNISVAYICKLHDKDGKLMVDKAMSLGLKPGPQYSILKKGGSVTTEDGQVIRPEDVVGPKEIGPVMIVLECPSDDFIGPFLSNEALRRHQMEGDGDTPAAVIHICPMKIQEDKRYQDWVNRFDPSVEHIFCTDHCHSVTHVKSRRMFLDEVTELSEFDACLKDLKAQFTEESKVSKPFTKYPEVVFLGTGSAMPNRERNVSGIMLHVSENQNLLMDCGEGTFNQLCRFYGDRTDEVISNLSCIFITHRHADHHIGLLQVLRYWKKLMLKENNNKPLILVAPKRIFIWLNQYNRLCEGIIHHLKFIENGDLTNSAEERSRHEETLLNKLSLKKFETVPVRHCSNAYGLVVTHQEGWKIVYSGDTMPCDALVTAGQDADLLLHEATLEDGMDEEAVIKKHSMMSQAIDVGERMNARFIILTHFSQSFRCRSIHAPSVHADLETFIRRKHSRTSENKMKRAEKEFFRLNELSETCKQVIMNGNTAEYRVS